MDWRLLPIFYRIEVIFAQSSGKDRLRYIVYKHKQCTYWHGVESTIMKLENFPSWYLLYLQLMEWKMWKRVHCTIDWNCKWVKDYGIKSRTHISNKPICAILLGKEGLRRLPSQRTSHKQNRLLPMYELRHRYPIQMIICQIWLLYVHVLDYVVGNQ